MIPIKSNVSSGPIYLDQLLCNENDANLQECNSAVSTFGLTTCDHTTDTWIRCLGILEFYVA